MLGEIQFVMVNGFINERPIPLVGFVGENDARQIKIVTFDDMSAVSVTELVIGDVEAGIFEKEQKTVSVFDRLSGSYVDRTQATLSIYLNEEMLGDSGLKFLQLVMYNETGEIVKKTNQFIVRVGGSNTPAYYAPETKTVKTLEAYAKEANKEAVKLVFGLQEEVTSSNDFVNKKVPYVYRGNEEDYQNGYWYYYDDTQKKWVPGGPYKNPTDEVLNLLSQKQDVLTFDSTPIENSQNPVTSDGVFKAISEHQITMDEFPINGSTNPVTSDGLYKKFGESDAQHQSLSARVGRVEEEQTELANDVQQNTTNIAQNASNISSQGAAIAEHQASISENASAIEEVRGIANAASTKADAVDTRLDNIIVESGTSDAETVAARTNSNTGITYTTLGQRLDTENSEIKEDLSTYLTAITGGEPIIFTRNHYYVYSMQGAKVSLTPTSYNGRVCALSPCIAGDRYIITLQGGGGVALGWSFCDEAGNVITRSVTNAIVNNALITAPAGSRYAVFNDTHQSETVYAIKITGKSNSRLLDVADLKVVAFGDSICRGGRNRNKGFIGDVGCKYVNMGVGGATLSNVTDSTASTDSVHPVGAANIPDQLIKYAESTAESWYMEPDAIIAEGGTNDYPRSELGIIPTSAVRTDADAEALDRSTVMGGLAYMFYSMVKLYPMAYRFFLLTNRLARRPWTAGAMGYTQTELNNAIRAVCKLYGVKVIDVFSDSPVDSFFSQYVSPTAYTTDPTVTDLYCIDTDQVHPLALGYKIGYAPFVREALATAIRFS